MARSPPGSDQRRLLDPGGHFTARLAADRDAIASVGAADDLDALQAVVHRLAGAAGTFGFSLVGDIAIAIDDGFAEGGAPTAADIARLLAALDQAVAEKSAWRSA